MKPREWGKAPAKLVDAFGSAMADLPGAEPRKMFGYPAAFVNGQMFTGIFEDRWFVRLGDDDRAELRAEGGAPFEPMPGRPMREYVELPPAMLSDPPRRDAWLARSLDYAAGLPPKQRKGR